MKINFSGCFKGKSNSKSPQKTDAVEKAENEFIIGEALTFDDFLKKIDSFGKFQKSQWIVLFFITLPQAWYSYIPVFTAMKVTEEHVSCSYGNGTIPACGVFNGTACSRRKYDAGFTSIVTDYDMFCDSKMKIAMTKSIFYIGKLMGAIFFGWLSDRYGRRIALLSSGILQFLGSLATSFATNYYVYVALRFPMGVGSGGHFLAAFLLVTEIVDPSKRNFANAMMQSGSGVAIGIEAIVAYVLPNWKTHNLTISLLNLLCFWYLWLTPESARWNFAKGRRKRAESILKTMAKVNKREFSSELWSRVQLKETHRHSKKYNARHLFKTRYLTKVTLIECYSWICVSLVFYGLGFNSTSLSGNVYINFAVTGLIEIPASIAAAIVVNMAGRRIPGCLYFITGGLALLAVVPIQLTGNMVKLEKLVLALTLIGKFMATACMFQTYIHTVELYPTVIRNVGLGVASATGRIGGIIAPIITDNAPPIVIPVVFGAAPLVAGLLRLLLPETKGRPLPEAFEDEIRKKSPHLSARSASEKESPL